MKEEMPDSNSLSEVLSQTAELARLFAVADKRLYLVGGAVRDLLTGGETGGQTAGQHHNFDLDFTTDATPDETKEIVEGIARSMWLAGEKFGTIGFSMDVSAPESSSPEGSTPEGSFSADCEITSHRKEAYDPTSRKPIVNFGKNIADDLARRDFTINAVAIRLPDGEVIDPFGGIADMQQRVLSTPLSPEESFKEDPLRMLRAARFVAKFNLTPTQELVTAAKEMCDRMSIVSDERIGMELEKMLLLDDPTPALAFCQETKLDEHLLEGGFVQMATTLGMRLAQLSPYGNAELRFAAMIIPTETGGEIKDFKFRSFRQGFSRRLAEMTEDLLATLGDIADIRRWQLQAAGRPSTSKLGTNQPGNGQPGTNYHLKAAIEIAEVIAKERALQKEFAEFKQIYSDQKIAELCVPVSGDDIMEHLKIPEGRLVGEAIKHLKELLIANGQMTSSEALQHLTQWHKHNMR